MGKRGQLNRWESWRASWWPSQGQCQQARQFSRAANLYYLLLLGFDIWHFVRRNGSAHKNRKTTIVNLNPFGEVQCREHRSLGISPSSVTVPLPRSPLSSMTQHPTFQTGQTSRPPSDLLSEEVASPVTHGHPGTRQNRGLRPVSDKASNSERHYLSSIKAVGQGNEESLTRRRGEVEQGWHLPPQGLRGLGHFWVPCSPPLGRKSLHHLTRCGVQHPPWLPPRTPSWQAQHCPSPLTRLLPATGRVSTAFWKIPSCFNALLSLFLLMVLPLNIHCLSFKLSRLFPALK